MKISENPENLNSDGLFLYKETNTHNHKGTFELNNNEISPFSQKREIL